MAENQAINFLTVHDLPKRSVAVTLSQSRLHIARHLVASSVVFVETSISPQGCSMSSYNREDKMNSAAWIS